MSKVKPPEGHVLTPREKILAGNRASSLRFELVSRYGIPLGSLDGVAGGTLEWNANSQVKGGGKLDVSTALDDPDLLKRAKTPDVIYRDRLAEGIVEWVPRVWSEGPTCGVSMVLIDDAPAMKVTFNGFAEQGLTFRARAPMRVGETYTAAIDVRSTELGASLNGSYEASPPDGFPPSDVTDARKGASSEWQTLAFRVTVDLPGRADEISFALNAYPPAGDGQWPYPTWPENVGGKSIYARNFRIYHGILSDAPERDRGKDIWPYIQIRPHISIKGMGESPLGTFIPSTPTTTFGDGSQSWDVELLDRTAIASEDSFEKIYSIPDGVNVIDEVWSILRSTGADIGNPPPDSSLPAGTARTLSKGRLWEPGTSKLTIINDILEAAGYMALWADEEGRFRVTKQIPAKDRPIAYEFVDGENCIYRPEFTLEKDLYSVPNKVIMIGQGDSETAAPTASALNLDRRSPLSYQNRGRWIADVSRGVEAETQAQLQAKANARLEQLTAAQGLITINHGPVPGVRVNDVVRFRRRGGAGIDGLYTVTSIRWPMNPTDLATTKLTEVLNFS